MDAIFTLRKPESELTFEDLAVKHFSGRSFLKSGEGRDKVYGYRHGVVTNLGDIEESEWCKLILGLITRSGELGLLEQLKPWAAAECPWLHTKREVGNYALELHACRIFDNPDWVSYELFNREYRPKAESKQLEEN